MNGAISSARLESDVEDIGRAPAAVEAGDEGSLAIDLWKSATASKINIDAMYADVRAVVPLDRG